MYIIVLKLYFIPPVLFFRSGVVYQKSKCIMVSVEFLAKLEFLKGIIKEEEFYESISIYFTENETYQ